MRHFALLDDGPEIDGEVVVEQGRDGLEIEPDAEAVVGGRTFIASHSPMAGGVAVLGDDLEETLPRRQRLRHLAKHLHHALGRSRAIAARARRRVEHPRQIERAPAVGRVRERDLATEGVTHHAGDRQRQLVAEARQILRCGGRSRAAAARLRLAVHAQIDQHEPPVRRRGREAAREGSKLPPEPRMP